MLKKVSDRDIGLVPDEPAARVKSYAPPEENTEATQTQARPRYGFRWVFLGGLKAIFQFALMAAILAGSYFVMERMVASREPVKKRPAFRTVYTIDTVTAKIGDRRPVFTAYGQTVASRTVDLRALVSGEVVKISSNLQAGSAVRAGEALVEIDDFNYRGGVQDAEASLAEAQARIDENVARIDSEKSKEGAMREQFDLAGADLKRAERLRKRGSGTQQQLEARQLIVSQRQQAMDLAENTIKIEEARLAQQRAALGRLEWMLSLAKRNLESTVLKAPFDAIVSSANVEIGRLLSVNDVAVSLYEQDALEARFTLTDAQYGRLQADPEGLVGRKVEVMWNVGGKTYTYPAEIIRLGAEITSNRGGVELFAKLTSTEGAVTIRPGAFVEVRIPDVEFRNTFSIPDTALFGGNIVYTNVDGKLVENRVEIAAFDNDRVIISSGLKDGDKVLNTRITEVSAGLNVLEEDEAGPARDRPLTADGDGSGEAPRGRASPEELAKIANANDMTMDEFRALSVLERRKLVQAFRQNQPVKLE